MRFGPRRWFSVIGVLGSVALCLPRYSVPCSVERVLTAVELVDRADAIVRVKALRFESRDRYGGVVVFAVQEALKGGVEDSVVTLRGSVDRYFGANDAKPPYEFVRPGGRRGSCFAEDYRIGAEYLVFLKGGTAYWAPLAAVNEEVSGPDDPWVWWVKGCAARRSSEIGPVRAGGR